MPRWLAEKVNLRKISYQSGIHKEPKRILISGGGYADLPLIRSAKKLGYRVITTGNRQEELGHKESDEYHAADFSDPEAILELAKHLDIDAICPCSNDSSATSSAYATECLGLPGHDPYETSKLLHHKDRYREFSATRDIPTPKARAFTDVDSAFSEIGNFRFPVMVKPVDLTGGKGIAKIDNLSEARSGLKQAFAVSKSDHILIEEFIPGSRHGLSAFICGGKVVFYFPDNEYCYLNSYLVSAASTPTTVPRGAIAELILQSDRIASLLSLKTGLFTRAIHKIKAYELDDHLKDFRKFLMKIGLNGNNYEISDPPENGHIESNIDWNGMRLRIMAND